ncbi:hypothetical protein GCM10010206_37160 [Streptomyces cinerochromogenes]|nr:hypothetical protein GCM10010206_37160 [Streptomyces cinerochromogenes]
MEPCADAGAAHSASAVRPSAAAAAALRRADMGNSSERSWGWAESRGGDQKLAPENREIPCWERLEEILMVRLRERSDCAQADARADTVRA